MKIGDKIKQKRQEKNITRETLAEDLDISIHTLAKYEQNQREPKLEMLKKIAGYLECSLYDLTGTYDKNSVTSYVNDIKKSSTDMDSLLNAEYSKLDNLNNIPTPELNEIKSFMENIRKSHTKLKNLIDEQTSSMEETLQITKDTTGKVAFISLCKICGLELKNIPNEFNEEISDYNVNYKTEDFNISEEDFQRFFRTISKFIIKEGLNTRFYDFIDE